MTGACPPWHREQTVTKCYQLKKKNMSKEAIIKAFEGVNVRIVWDDEKQEYFFSVNDIVEVLTESTDVKQYIKRMRSRDPELNTRWGTICTPTRMRAADGKYYKTQAATMKGILRIVQSIPSRKAEPLKQWLAEVGRSVISSAKASDYISPSQEPELLEGGDNNKD